jgi:hypothetical protein
MAKTFLCDAKYAIANSMYIQDLRSAARKRLFACGSMVLAIYLCAQRAPGFLRSQSAKNETQKKIKYRCA